MIERLPSRPPKEPLNPLFDSFAWSCTPCPCAASHSPQSSDACLLSHDRRDPPRLCRHAAVDEFDPGAEVGRVGQRAAAVETELVGQQRGVLSTDAKGDDRASIADHGLAQQRRQLPKKLVGENQRQSILARLRQDRRKAVGGKVLELVGIKREIAAVGFGRVDARLGRLREGSDQEGAEQVGGFGAKPPLGQVDD